jgi:hypothetical protein
MNEFLWERVRMFFLGVVHLIPIFLTITAIFLLLGPLLKLQSWWLAAPYFFCALISAVTIGKIGSDVNYLLELTAAVCFATALALGSLKQTVLKLILLTAVTLQIFLLGSSAQPRFRYRIEAFAARLPELDRAMKSVRECNGIVLADELMTLIPLSGKRIYYQPFTMVQNVREGKWNETPFVNEIKQEKFALILMSRSGGAFWTPAMKEAIANRYILVDRFRIYKDNPVRVYLPQGTADDHLLRVPKSKDL